MAPHAPLGFLYFAVVLLATAVVVVAIARRLRLSPIVAYIFAGVLIGPFGLGLFPTAESILGIAELGVVLLLFLIGLELESSKLLTMRRAIFGLGAAQLLLTTTAIAAIGCLSGLLSWRGALVAGVALAMSATSVALRILEERGHLQRTYGQRAFAILLFQDMAVVGVLALLPLLAPVGADHSGSLAGTVAAVAMAAAAIGAVILVGRYLLNPLFSALAKTGAREVMTAAALLVVLGTALLMHSVGMSMALGAFLAGVVLAESNYRHELEADIEPFRGLLLALFFIGIGVGIDLAVVRDNLALILGAAVLLTLLKAGIVWILFRATCAHEEDALRAGSILTGAGEFAFVLLPLGASLGLLTTGQANILTAIAAVSLMLGPPTATLTEALLHRLRRRDEREPDDFDDAHGSVLLIGFGRFGQMAAQCLLAQGTDVTIIDNDAEMIQSAARFGFKVYYGDGTRLNVLRAANADNARLIAICTDRRETTDRIVALVRAEFPGTKLYVRSYDRGHTLDLIRAGVDYEMRETYESALVFGTRALEAVGFDPEIAQATQEEVRRRDRERLALQEAGDFYAGTDLMTRGPTPEPLVPPRTSAKPLSAETQDMIRPKAEVS
jgi:glutathione-regulated potassium-efflux system protein KefB